MRLINTTTLRLEEFTENVVPSYAILSHTWGDTEVTFQDIDLLKNYETSGLRARKIRYCCKQARGDGLSHAWVDTCCIDKSSSAELSEAINSMFRWYRESQICYVYLSDLDLTVKDAAFATELAKCRWFTRGWTLQELLAPRQIKFFNRSWAFVGSKKDLSRLISRITRIDPIFIQSNPSLSSASIARRMSWASQRQTTRVEDLAYCLLGIFEINMPLLYGEGSRSFLRLQETIMKDSLDQSLFAWQSTERTAKCAGVLATHPSQFKNSGDIFPYPTPGEPYSITNNGLRIQVPIATIPASSDTKVAVLGCQHQNDIQSSLGIILEPTEIPGQFGRGDSERLGTVSWENAARAKPRTIYLCTEDVETRSPAHRISKFGVQTLPIGYRIIEVAPDHLFDPTTRLVNISREDWGGASNSICCIAFHFQAEASPRHEFVVIVKLWGDGQYAIGLVKGSPTGTLSEYRDTNLDVLTSTSQNLRFGDFPQAPVEARATLIKTTRFGQQMLLLDVQVKDLSEQTLDETTALLSRAHISGDDYARRKIHFLQRALRNMWMAISGFYLLSPCILLGIVAGALGWNPVLVMAINSLAISPLCLMLSNATDQIVSNTGAFVGLLLITVFGNAAELIIGTISLIKGEIRIVQASMIGSILFDLLLALGYFAISGGWNLEQRSFNNPTAINSLSSVLVIASASLITIPALSAASSTSQVGQAELILTLSRCTAIIMLILYTIFSWSETWMGHEMYDLTVTTEENTDDEFELQPTNSSTISAWLILIIATVFMAICATYLVGSIESVVNSTHISRNFIGLILLPVMWNAGELSSLVGARSRMEFAVGVIIVSCLEIILFITPVLVLFAWIINRDMALDFNIFETSAFLVSVVVVTFVVRNGRTNFLEGVMCVGIYVIFATVSFV